MLISDARRALFVHVPKTGGVSVEKSVRPVWPDARKKVRPHQGRHASLERILVTEPALVDYWTFGFVRNPWARMVSWWSMIDTWNKQRTAYEQGLPGAHKPRNKGNEMWRAAAQYSGFDEFVLRGTQELSRVGMPQITYLRAPTFDRQVDFIGRTESFADDLRKVQLELGLEPVPPPHRNKSSHGHYSDYYNDATRKRVAEVFAEDIELFGYSY